MQQVVHVPLQFLNRFSTTCRADDQAHALGDLQCGHHLAHIGAGITLDAAGNAASARIVRHQDQIAASQADIGGQRGPLGATLLLFDLDQEFLPFLQVILDVATADLLVGRQTEIGGHDFLERQETVSVRAKVHKGGLKAGFNPADHTFVNVGFFLFPRGNLDIKVVKFLAIHQRNAELLRLRGID